MPGCCSPSTVGEGGGGVARAISNAGSRGLGMQTLAVRKATLEARYSIPLTLSLFEVFLGFLFGCFFQEPECKQEKLCYRIDVFVIDTLSHYLTTALCIGLALNFFHRLQSRNPLPVGEHRPRCGEAEPGILLCSSPSPWPRGILPGSPGIVGRAPSGPLWTVAGLRARSDAAPALASVQFGRPRAASGDLPAAGITSGSRQRPGGDRTGP